MRVLMVGSAEGSKGGVASVIGSLKRMPLWREFQCRWLGTQVQGGKWLKARQALGAYVKALLIVWRFDAVHFHTVPDLICLVVQLPVFLLALIGRKKIIMHIHMGNQIAEHTRDRLFRWCLRRSDLVILLAHKWEEKWREWFADIDTPVTCLYNAAERVEPIGYEERGKTIVFAGHLNRNKAYDVLLRAFAIVNKRHPDWRLIVMGDGEIAKARAMACELGIGEATTFTDYITGQRKVELFQHASIFCLCSYQEGFPMVVLEAWGYGIPVVTTPVGGLPDVIEEDRNACTFPFGDYEAMAAQMCKLIESEQQRREMSEYSLAFVREHFSPETINQRLAEIYKSL